MRKVTIDLDNLSVTAIFEIAAEATEKEVLEAIYEMGLEHRKEGWHFIKLAKNKNPEIKEILEKICNLDDDYVKKSVLVREEFAENPFTPQWVLEKRLKEYSLSNALYNPNTPEKALNDCFPELLGYKRYIVENVVETNGKKLNNDVLRMIVEKYPDFELPKQILASRKK